MALIEAQDMRKRRSSVQSTHTEYVAKSLEVPHSLLLLNKVCRFWCIGSTSPQQSTARVIVTKLVIAAIEIGLLLVVNDARINGGVSFIVQFAFIIIQIITVMGWILARRHLNFDNILKTRWRTLKLLEQAGRPDLCKKVDDEAILSVAKDRGIISPIVCMLANIPAALFYIGNGNTTRAVIFLILFFLHNLIDDMCCIAFEMTCKLHSLQIQLYYDNLSLAFSDLAKATTFEEERRNSVISENDSRDLNEEARDSAPIPATPISIATLSKTAEFFDQSWVLNMSVAFIDICKTLRYTTERMAKFVAFYNIMFLFVMGLFGLSMLVKDVTLEGILICLLLLLFVIQSMMIPIETNKILRKVRSLSWDCYGELVSHSLLFTGQDEDLEAGSGARYQQICNSAKHCLNIIQTSKEGIKIGDVEYSMDLVAKILSIVFSATVVILKTGDLTPIANLMGGDEGSGTNMTAVSSTSST